MGARETFRGRWGSTPIAQSGVAKYAKPPYMAWRRKGNKRTRREPLKFRILFLIRTFYLPEAFRGGAPGDVPTEVEINTQHPTRRGAKYAKYAKPPLMGEGEMRAKGRPPNT